ncbi:MAG: histidine kinase [Parasphingorhabdus sp.]|uniref:sensor histidine kinase n=1 Tax=Parasphingorhabdus sp. TaxID=2709688 RepID=UPI003001D065
MDSRIILASDRFSFALSPFWYRIFPVNIDLAIKSIFGVWAGYFVVNSLRVVLWGASDHLHTLEDYLVTAIISVTVTWALYRLLAVIGERPAGAVFILTIPTIFMATGTVYLTNLILAYPMPVLDYISIAHGISPNSALSHFSDMAFVNYLILVGWGGLYLAMVNSRNSQVALTHRQNLERANRESEMRALRYQLNPHFVFNALNSVSSLVIDSKNEQAGQLVDSLADYMRWVLQDDSGDLITVEREIAQQVRYLEIEQVRFPDRMKFDVHIEDDVVREWKIPVLIVQPLIENAIKYGVARSSAPVCIAICATREAGRLKLVVANDGRMMAVASKTYGTGTGLANIRERLQGFYGPEAALFIGNGSGDRVVATIIIPDEKQMFSDSVR